MYTVQCTRTFVTKINLQSADLSTLEIFLKFKLLHRLEAFSKSSFLF